MIRIYNRHPLPHTPSLLTCASLSPPPIYLTSFSSLRESLREGREHYILDIAKLDSQYVDIDKKEDLTYHHIAP